MSHPLRDSGPIAWMVHNHVTPNLVMLVMLIGGVLMASHIKKEVFPEFDIDTIRISVAYPNASPEEVEKGIVLLIESAVRGVEGIKEVNSTASEGSASVSLDLLESSDPKTVLDDVEQEINRITTFPEDSKDPVVGLLSRRREVLNLVLYGEVAERILRDIAGTVRDRLLQQEGISQIDFEGARDHEVQVEIPQAKLRAYGLTIAQVADRIGDTAVEVPGGTIESRAGDILLRVQNRRDWAREFAELPIISTPDGAVVRLGDLATVRDSLEDSNSFAVYNGKPAIGLDIYRVGDQTPISVSDAVKEAMVDIAAELPPGVAYDIRLDRSDIYKQRLHLLLRNGLVGLGLVLVLLGVFLDFKLAFWVTMGIPTAFLGSFLLLPGLDASINMISMFAFIIALGIVVDDAIIAGENIYEYRQRGMSFIKAAILGAQDITVPISFAILTNVVAFIPLYFIPGTMGNIFGIIPVVVITTFLVSWFEALFILPTHLAYSKRADGNAVSRFLVRQQEKVAGLLTLYVRTVYQPLLRLCVAHRYITVAAGLSLLFLVLTYALSGRMGFILMPRVEADYAYVSASLPVGSPLEKVVAVRDRLLTAAERMSAAHGGKDLVEGTFSRIDGNELWVRVYLTDPDLRPISTTEATKLWRQETGQIPGLEFIKFQADRGGPGSGAGVTVELSHSDVGVLDRAAADLARALEDFPEISDVDDGSASGKRQISFALKSEGVSLGLTDYDVARQIRAAFVGVEALTQQRGDDEVTVLVRLPRSERIAEQDIEDFLVRTPAGTDVPLREVAQVSWGRAYTSISRRDGRRALQVSADVTPLDANQKIKTTLKEDILPALRRDYPGLSSSFQGRAASMAESVDSLKASFVFALIAIYVLLAIPFRSYVQPLIVMSALPLGIVGAILGHLIMGYSLSVVSIMGVIALSGVVINDSLVMIDYANHQMTKGLDHREAIIQAGMRRFRPILLTTLTTFGGLAPMIFETSRQARFMVPMAVSLGFGILFATAIILVFVPSLFAIVEDIRDLLEDPATDQAPEIGADGGT
ncbi:efflux RND transporter permease subunit [Magnetospira thiophila]